MATNASNNTTAATDSKYRHERDVAEIEAERNEEIERKKIAAQERVMHRMIDNGQFDYEDAPRPRGQRRIQGHDGKLLHNY